MSALGLSSDVTVRRLVVRDGGQDPLVAGSRAGRVVGAAVVRPRGLPPSAVLLVRSLRDPLPGRVRLDGGAAPLDWESAVAKRLGRLARAAARPAAGPVAAGAAAVLFEDEATLLACLARDHARGVAAERWWWRLIAARLGGAPPSAVALLAAAPEHVPAAFELLAASGDAVAAGAALGPAGAATVLAAVRTAHGVPAAAQEDDPRPVVARAAQALAVPAPAYAVPAAPWSAIVPELRAAPLAPAVEELLGTALALRRRPAQVRAAAFARAAARWRADAEAAADRAPPAAAGQAPPPASTPTPPAAAASPPCVARRRAGPSPVPPPRPGAAAAPSPGRPRLRSVPAAPPEAVPEEPVPEPAVAPAPAPAPSAPVPGAVAPEPVTRLPTVRPEPVRTRLGGLFYLLDAALALELYGDFTTPLSPGIALDPWDFVALLGAHLLREPHADDPVWPLLAALAGRWPDGPPGAGLAAPRRWRAPAPWLSPFGEAELAVRRPAPGRLALWHPAGFPVIDVARRGPPGSQRVRELRRRPPPEAPGPVRLGAGAVRRRPLRLWVGWVGAYLQARLGAALGTPDRPSLSRRLLEHDAAVHVTPAHVDVVLSLARLPLEVRTAGLDRTPGWIPAAGRHLAFHFE